VITQIPSTRKDSCQEETNSGQRRDKGRREGEQRLLPCESKDWGGASSFGKRGEGGNPAGKVKKNAKRAS